MGNRYDNAVQRISDIDWKNIGLVDKASNVALAKEYLRRAALLIKTFSLNTRFPFFSAAKAFGKSPHIDILKSCPGIEKMESSFIRGTCECYLEWAFLNDEMKEPALIQFQDPYEPLIMLFERGGTMGLHHGEVIVGRFAFPREHWSIIAIGDPIDVSDSGLEKWDR